MNTTKTLLVLVTILLLSTISMAATAEMTLLTVAESGNDTVGGTAKLVLETKPGSGRVFIDSVPLTKIDTQMSTRLAKQVACDFTEKDCSKTDFFYTIRAGSPIVGGPSAGSAIAMLTSAVLLGEDVDSKTAMTGTINSGGLIGPVAGIKEKVQVAKKKGFTKVLVPKWSVIDVENGTNESNVTFQYADDLEIEGIEIVTVSTLQEALHEFTGREYVVDDSEIEIPKKYQEIMGKVAKDLCGRYDNIKQETEKFNQTILNETETKMERARESIQREDYYSAASYCFSADAAMRQMQFGTQESEEIVNQIKEQTENMLEELENRNLDTLSDLETYIIVKDRLFEVQSLLDENDSIIQENLGYTYERMYSAVAWSNFFSYNEKPVHLNDQYLEEACLTKIAEAEEIDSYLGLILGDFATQEDDLRDVREIHRDGDYAFCLYKATQVKSESNAVLSTLAITQEKLPDLVADKLYLAKIQINEQGESFPILGYSYYNYASSLLEDSPGSALIFSQYASEFSNLDIYFPKMNVEEVEWNLPSEFFWFIGGLILGVVIMMPFVILKKRGSKPRKTSKPKRRNPPGKKR